LTVLVDQFEIESVIMGSSQSQSASTSTTPGGSTKSTTMNDEVEIPKDDTRISFHVEKSKENNLKGMELVNHKCRKRKKKYDTCSSDWYNDQFMTGKSMHQEEVCGDLFENYRTCILKGIKQEVWDKQGLPPPLEGSPLAEIEDDRE
jgi:hypothetical protein